MKNSKYPRLTQFCALLIKVFFSVVASILIFCLMLGVFGEAGQAMILLTTTFPWLIRSMICIGCALTITSLSESL